MAFLRTDQVWVKELGIDICWAIAQDGVFKSFQGANKGLSSRCAELNTYAIALI
jgi:hypothetical protein